MDPRLVLIVGVEYGVRLAAMLTDPIHFRFAFPP